MQSAEWLLAARWFVIAWALGWLALPWMRRVFGFLPDAGLAVGRLLALTGITLAAFFAASIGLAPLGLGLGVGLLALTATGVFAWWRAGARGQSWRLPRRALAVSDALWAASFIGFLWVRARNPALLDLEKPMDVMLLAGASRAQWLPFENPWLADTLFTNYYYFGPLLSATMARWTGAAPWLAYNLAQPLFCAFFISILWSAIAALCGSKRWGMLGAALVALSGPLEPLRQWATKGWGSEIFWWDTSRVIDHTINEYPAFTLLIGDLHAHFYALSFGIALVAASIGMVRGADSKSRGACAAVGGSLLAVIALTNTWDVPVYALVWAGALWLGARSFDLRGARLWRGLVIPALIGLGAAGALALPYFWKLRAPVSGVVFEPWFPALGQFALFWGGWMALSLLALGLWRRAVGPREFAARARSLGAFHLLALAALVALAAPSLFYVRGAFGDGELRHMDTVFKFYLQAWLLGGVCVGAALGAAARAGLGAPETRTRTFCLASLALAALVGVPLLGAAPHATLRARALIGHERALSLDGLEGLALADREAIRWLHGRHLSRESLILETAKRLEDGTRGGDFDGAFYGRVAALTGVPTLLAWPGHLRAWGADGALIEERARLLDHLEATASTDPLVLSDAPDWMQSRSPLRFWGALEAAYLGAPPPPHPIAFRGLDGSLCVLYPATARRP